MTVSGVLLIFNLSRYKYKSLSEHQHIKYITVSVFRRNLKGVNTHMKLVIHKSMCDNPTNGLSVQPWLICVHEGYYKGPLATQFAHKRDCDQTGQIFAGCKKESVGFVTQWLNYVQI